MAPAINLRSARSRPKVMSTRRRQPNAFRDFYRQGNARERASGPAQPTDTPAFLGLSRTHDPPRSLPAACRQTGLEDRPCKPHTTEYLHSLGTFYSTSASSCRAEWTMVRTVSFPAEWIMALTASFVRSMAPLTWSDTVMARKLSSGRSHESMTPCRAPVAGGRRAALAAACRHRP